jgi:crotonobetainyl-CoA:carnitine CoA-transferase CaiB-like acyl-CoA transferase
MVTPSGEPAAPTKALPLEGISVLDLTRFVSGAYATMLLSALGADVIKVELLPGGDPYRSQGTAFVDDTSLLFAGLNTGKRSLAVDVRAVEGREVVERLLADSDVLVQNARPGSLAKLELDEPSVRRRHPRLIYASLSGYGQTGPDASRGGFDLILQADSGLMSVTGDPASGPVKIGAPLLDIGSGICCALAVLAGLLARERGGTGSHVTASLLEFALAGFSSTAASTLASGELPGLLGSHSPMFAPYGSFRTGAGAIVLAGAGTEQLWQRMCAAIDAPELAEDPRFADNASRVAHRDELTDRIEARLAGGTATDWATRLEAIGVPCSVVRSVPDALRSAQATALRSVRKQTSGDVEYAAVAPPFAVDGALEYPRGAPALGEHSREVLARLGLDPARITELIAAGTVTTT